MNDWIIWFWMFTLGWIMCALFGSLVVYILSLVFFFSFYVGFSTPEDENSND